MDRGDPHRDRPRVLYVGRGAPWRGGAGYLVRQAMWLNALTRVADVTAVMFDLDPKHAAGGVADAGCEGVVAVPNPERAHPGGCGGGGTTGSARSPGRCATSTPTGRGRRWRRCTPKRSTR